MAERSAQVPYTSYSTVSADNAPNPGLKVESNPTDFGSQVGSAVQQAGQEGNDIGKQTVALATEMGSIYNDSTARDGVVKGSIALGNLEDEYRKNKGLDAANALKTFQDKSQQLYSQMAQGMPTTGAQQLFKDQFSKEVAYSLKNAGSWAADQTFAAQKTSLTAGLDNDVSQMASAGGDPQRVGQKIIDIQTKALQLAHADGLPPDVADQTVSHYVGEGAASTIRTAMVNNPDLAKSLYTQFSTGSFAVTRNDANGNPVQVQIPYIDAQHRAQISSEMSTEFHRQAREQSEDARSLAMSGNPFDEKALTSSLKNIGYTDESIQDRIIHLNSMKNTYGNANSRYDLEKTMDNNRALATQGQPVKELDPDQVRAAFPKEPDKANDLIQENNNLKIVSATTSSFHTQTPEEIQQSIDKFKPSATPTTPVSASDSAITTVLHNEGGYVAQDGSSGAPAIYGINQKWHPDEYAAAKKLSDEKGDAAGQEYARNFYKTQYFDAKKIGDLPANTQAIVMDGVVNHTTGFGDKLIQAAKDGASPQQLIDMRRNEYQRLATNNPDDYAKSLPGWNSRLDGLQSQAQSGGNNFADQQRLYTTLTKAASDYTKALNADPAGSTASNDPRLGQMLADGVKDYSKLGTFIDASLVRQAQLGVPEEGLSALPKNVAQGITDTITKNPEQAPAAINSLQQKTGGYWPDVLHSLVTKGDLPAKYQSISQFSQDPATQRYGTLLAKWGTGDDVKNKETSDLVGGPKNETTIKDIISSDTSTQQFKESLARAGASPQQSAEIGNTMNELAYSMVYFERKSPEEAARESVKAFTSGYEFLPNGNARVPSANFDAVTANANLLLNNLQDKASPLPVATLGYHGIPDAKTYFDHVKAAPTWITSPREDSLLLKDPWNHLVTGKDGKPISVPFNAPMPQNYKPVQSVLSGNGDARVVLGTH